MPLVKVVTPRKVTKSAAVKLRAKPGRSPGPMRVHRIELRQTRTRSGLQWSWRMLARNGRKLGWSGEFYKKRRDCLDALAAVQDTSKLAVVHVMQGRRETYTIDRAFAVGCAEDHFPE